jgi:hypothetical protein
MKIYAITKGDYSEYHICRLTTDYEKAKRYKEAYSDRCGEAWIETYEDNENDEQMLYWQYNLDTDTLTLSETIDAEKIWVRRDGSIYRVDVRASDKVHAFKKVFDMLAKYKAEQAGL